jgi:hypothetical protein
MNEGIMCRQTLRPPYDVSFIGIAFSKEKIIYGETDFRIDEYG